MFSVLSLLACDSGQAPPRPPSTASIARPTVTAPPKPASEPRPVSAQEREFRDQIATACLANLQQLAASPLVVESVAGANRSNRETQAEILAKDQQWRQVKGASDPLIAPYLANPCAELLAQTQKAQPDYAELFVMDAKGCIVAASSKTSDYWQGDEAKWIESYADGDGKVFVDDVKYDQSTQAYVVQISLPVRDAAGKAIGAMTASVLARGTKTR